MLKPEIYRVLDDLRSDLEDFEWTDETWGETIEYAVNNAWDRLGKIENPV